MSDYRPKIEQRILRQTGRALLLLSIALLQTALLPGIWRFQVDLVLIVVVGWTLLRGLVPGLRWAIYGGLSLDLLGMMPMGTHLLALAVCVVCVYPIAAPFDTEQPLLVVVMTLGAAMVYECVLAAVLYSTGVELPWQRYALVDVIPTALIDTMFAIPIFALLRRLHQRGQIRVEA